MAEMSERNKDLATFLVSSDIGSVLAVEQDKVGPTCRFPSLGLFGAPGFHLVDHVFFCIHTTQTGLAKWHTQTCDGGINMLNENGLQTGR